MLNVTIIAVGGLKERYFSDACAEYQKRLTAFCKLHIIETGEYKLGQNPSAAEIEKCLLSEGKAILSKIPHKAYVIPMCIEGDRLSSQELAEKITKISGESSHLVFIIGGSHGLSDEVKAVGGYKLSMSPMTFPHQLTRIMLLEQVYRVFSINSGMKYHK